jgi:Transcription antiterminator
LSKPVLRSHSRWFVVRTNPNCEDRAARSLSRAGYGAYVPTWKREVQHRRSKKWVEYSRPLMTGYLFVEMPYGTPDWFTLRACNGVKGVLGVTDARGDTKPFPVPSRLVERVMSAQLNMMFDDTREAKARRGEQAVSLYMAGTKVMVTKGPFATFPATVDEVRQNGVVASLIEIFGRMTLVELAPDQIELAAA